MPWRRRLRWLGLVAMLATPAAGLYALWSIPIVFFLAVACFEYSRVVSDGLLDM